MGFFSQVRRKGNGECGMGGAGLRDAKLSPSEVAAEYRAAPLPPPPDLRSSSSIPCFARLLRVCTYELLVVFLHPRRLPASRPASRAPAFIMILGSNICLQKTLYEILSVTEDATYDEIRAAYKSAALNTHPDKAQTTVEASVLSNEQQEFLSVQKAWEILRHPNSRAEYDKQLQSSRQNIEIISSEIEVGDMIVENTGDIVELLYPCRCGDYFTITSRELGEMGVLITHDGDVELQSSDSVSASIVLGCGSCSLKTRLVINNS
ncbi:hypothetical protein EJB05_58112, partial [Eragrostis curvula]